MMESVRPEIVHDPCAWRASDFDHEGRFTLRLDPDAIDSLAVACGQDEGEGSVASAQFYESSPTLSGCLAEQLEGLRNELTTGKGFVLLRGLPFDAWGVEGSRRATWAIANSVGYPVSQTADGSRLVDVRDTSGRESTPRQFSTNRELRLHTDPASDLIGLACIRSARSGGESVLVSAVSVHNAMLERRPDLLAELYHGFHWHRFGEGRPEDAPITDYRVPVFSNVKGQLSCRYVRSAIVAGHRDLDRPLTSAQIAALDLLDQIAASEELRVVFRLQPGDFLLVNNLAVMHARTEFFDHDEPMHTRHLLRLWLSGFPGFRSALAELNYFNGGVCGIPSAQGMKSHYDMNALYSDKASGGAARLGVNGPIQR
jgi:Taurine catabolism dioxygenase TauD, TfdA family